MLVPSPESFVNLSAEVSAVRERTREARRFPDVIRLRISCLRGFAGLARAVQFQLPSTTAGMIPMLASRPYRTLLAVAATVLVGLMLARAAAHGDFGMSARLRADHVEVQFKVAALCVRVVAQLPGQVRASAHLFSCGGGCLLARSRYLT